jgi:hypothetical protein
MIVARRENQFAGEIMKKDIQSRLDIDYLMNRFYARATRDRIICQRCRQLRRSRGRATIEWSNSSFSCEINDSKIAVLPIKINKLKTCARQFKFQAAFQAKLRRL